MFKSGLCSGLYHEDTNEVASNQGVLQHVNRDYLVLLLPIQITEFIPTESPLTSTEAEPTSTLAKVSLTEDSDRPRTPEETSEGHSTTDIDVTTASVSSGSNHGETVAIILVTLLLIIIAGAVIGIIGYMLRRGQKERKSKL